MARRDRNPFSLQGARSQAMGLALEHRPDQAPAPHRQWTPEEQKEALGGYMEVPRHMWPYVRVRAHVYYNYRVAPSDTVQFAGGYVRGNPVEDHFDPPPAGGAPARKFLKLCSSEFGALQHCWNVCYDNITKLFVRFDAQTAILYEMVGKSAEKTLARILEPLQALAGRVSALERALERLERRRP